MASIIKVDQIQSDSGTVNVSSNLQFSSGFTLANPTIVTPTTSGVMTLGAGIKFPATQVSSDDANTLDDYEEGTWTPQAYVGGTACTMGNSSVNFGTYVKVGRMVYVTARVATASFNGGSGTFYVYGLPFTCTAQSRSGGSFQFADFAIPSGYTQVNCSIQASDTYVRYDLFRTSSYSDLMTGAQVGNGNGHGWGLCYMSAS